MQSTVMARRQPETMKLFLFKESSPLTSLTYFQDSG
jgi:hypothetical protein